MIVFAQIIIETGSVALAWYWFNWKMAVILLLVYWARNLQIKVDDI